MIDDPQATAPIALAATTAPAQAAATPVPIAVAITTLRIVLPWREMKLATGATAATGACAAASTPAGALARACSGTRRRPDAVRQSALGRSPEQVLPRRPQTRRSGSQLAPTPRDAAATADSATATMSTSATHSTVACP